MLGVLPTTALAAIVPTDFVTAINYEVGGVAKDNFNPSGAEVLTIKLSYDMAHFAPALATATGTIKIKQGATTVKTFPAINGIVAADQTLTWNGIESDGNFCSNPPSTPCANGTYSVEVVVNSTIGADTWSETESKNFTIGAPVAAVAITTFTSVPTKGGATFDPAPSADDEDLALNYTLNKVADVEINIKDSKDKTIKTFNKMANSTGSFSWDGTVASKLVAPGTYKVVLTATKAGEATATQSKDLVVAYNNASKPGIDNYTLSTPSFDPDVEDTAIGFTNLRDANITVEIRQNDGVVVRTFSNYEDDNFNAGDTHNVVWNGKNSSGTIATDGGYKVFIELRNEYGVTTKEDTITLINTSGSISSSNNHIDDISFSPSSKFKPGDDEELKIEFDAKVDLAELTISAVRGNDRYEIDHMEELDKETNLETTWDGKDDDDEFVPEGTWKIEFKSKVGSTTLTAIKSIIVEYDKPVIDEFLISKTKFDNELGESTYALFKVDRAAQITLAVMLDGEEDDTLEEEMEVEEDRWYAVQFDGGSYDYSDSIALKLTAANISNIDVYDSEKITVDLAEDDTSSNVSNVTNDDIDPVVTDGKTEMTVNFELEEEADVDITIYKGKNTTSTKVVEIFNQDNLDSGSHSIPWNGRDEDGSTLSKGFYTYKIVSHKSSTDTETGTFVIGESDDLQSTGGSSNGGSSNGGGNSNTTKCANFTDVSASSELCEAITWAKDSGVVSGYADGTFKPSSPINRVEMLKVVLEALGIGPELSVSGNLGFKDVETGAWYMGYIKAGKDRGIFNGDSGMGTARPGDTVNRVEALKLALETVRIQKGLALNRCESSYADVKSTDWFSVYACQAAQYDLFDISGNNLAPGTLSSRGEIVEMLYRMHKAGLL